MSSQKVYRIEKFGPRGEFAVAVRDIMPGEVVLIEKEPLLYYRTSIAGNGIERLVNPFTAFMTEVSQEKQRKLLALFGPTTGMTNDAMRQLARDVIRLPVAANGIQRKLTSDEVEKFVKVFQVGKMHTQGAKHIGYAVYDDVSRFGHSCDSNVKCVLQDRVATCIAKRFIKAGDKLTIPCISHRDLEPIHERRRHYLETKEFTCHCPRCDALGDDTRQFDCFDPACDGVMMACQPINKMRLLVPDDISYTGVEYVEPHLLPCTVCHRAAPADYQAKMFQVEAQLPRLAEMILQRFLAFTGKEGPQELFCMLSTILPKKIARRHAAVLPLLNLEYRIKYTLFLCDFLPAEDVQMALRAYLAAYENLFPFAHNELCKELHFAAVLCCNGVNRSVLPLLQEKELCQKSLRMHLLLHGRNRRDSAIDDITARVLKQLPPTVLSTEVCAFCEESPLCAALILSRCGRCKQITYCSAGCQKAHWPQHKKTCKTQENK